MFVAAQIQPVLKIVTPLNETCCYRHYSVWVGNTVYHFNEQGAHCESADTFMAKRRVIKERKATKSAQEVIAYYEQNKHRPYNWLTYNCEHFATECATGKRQSPTLRGYVSAAIIVLFAGIMGWIYRTNNAIKR